METRKSPKADLEMKKGIFFEIGLVMTLVLVILAFQLRTREKTVKEITYDARYDIPEEIIPVTEHEKPPPKPPTKSITPIIRIVEDDIEVDDFIRIDAEADQNTEVEEYVPPEVVEMQEEEEQREREIFYIVESMPEFPGGEEALYNYLSANLRYPTVAREAGITGKVFVAFVVEPDGSVSNIKVLRGIGGGCDEEAIRVVENMPRWVPGKQRGKPVRVHFNLPIKFTLQ